MQKALVHLEPYGIQSNMCYDIFYIVHQLVVHAILDVHHVVGRINFGPIKF